MMCAGISRLSRRHSGWGAILLLLVSLIMPTAAAANPFGSPSAAEDRAKPTLVEQASTWILQTQRDLHRQLTKALHQLDEAPTVRTAAALILASFLYGIFHAAGPGHGKAVISTYLLTNRQSLGRGIWLSTAASLFQGVTAIVAVVLLIGILGWLARDTMGQVRNLELASFLLVALLGLWLIGRGLRALWRLRNEARSRSDDLEPPSGNTEQGGAAAPFTRVSNGSSTTGAAPGMLLRVHPDGPGHTADCGCGTPHHVNPNQRGPWYATVFAVGIRPCSGAVLVMAVSYLLGIWMAGIAAVLAMSMGTAITVSVLAILAVQARDWTRRVLRPTRLASLRHAGPLVGIAGGTVIFLIGWTLFQGALSIEPMRHPLGL